MNKDYSHIHLEGSLFSWDTLSLIAQGKAVMTDPSSYGLPGSLHISDVAGSAYTQARGYYQDYKRRKPTPQATATLVTGLLSSALGWKIEPSEKAERGGRSYPITRFSYGIPVVIVPGSESLDEAHSRYAVKGAQRKISPHNMLQQYLSASAKTEWGIVLNSERLRLLRSSVSISRPEYLQFDYADILTSDSFSDFLLLWMMLHVSRIWDSRDFVSLSVWEEWRNSAIEDGVRSRESLRTGVEKAILSIAKGFLDVKGRNTELIDALRTNKLSADRYYHEVLLLVYRILFISVLEERYSENGMRMIFSPDATEEAMDAYDKGYSISRLRHLMRKPSYRSGRYHDLYVSLNIVFSCLSGEKDGRKLGLSALGGLFSDEFCPDLKGLYLSNSSYLDALGALRWTEDNGSLVWADYQHLGTTELGSVYESLLENIPQIAPDTLAFSFKATAAFGMKKTTGSYYTPDYLVDELVRSALEPVLEERLRDAEDEESAILSMKVVDPSCGSGHFLVAAAESLATRLSSVREESGSVKGYHDAFREVIQKCLYGVDLNPMAVELTKMSLWLEGYAPGKPLTFLDSHIKCGNSLVGVSDSSVMTEKGIPSSAYCLVNKNESSIKTVLDRNTREIKSVQRQQAAIQSGQLYLEDLFSPVEKFSVTSQDTLEDVEKESRRYGMYLERLSESSLKRAMDIYTSAFFLPPSAKAEDVPTTGTVLNVLRGDSDEEHLSAKARESAERNRFFHWTLEFPEVFENGGFDVVLGNPPWDKVKLEDVKFFSSRIPEIADAPNAAERKKMIARLPFGNDYERKVYLDYIEAGHSYKLQSSFYHIKKEEGGAYPLSGTGDMNLYALFSELSLRLMKEDGAIGLVVPTGICTDKSTAALFSALVGKDLLSGIYDFENGSTVTVKDSNGKEHTEAVRMFPAVDSRYKFSLLTLRRGGTPDYCFYLHSVKEAEDERRHYPLRSEDIRLMNPNTLTLPVIRSRKDYDVLLKIYRNSRVLWDETRKDGNIYGISFKRMFDMSNDSGLFHKEYSEDCLPLYEGKSIYIYDHRMNTYVRENGKDNPKPRYVTAEEKRDPEYEISPQYWVDKKDVERKYYAGDGKNDGSLSQSTRELPSWLFGFRDIARATDKRTSISTIFPFCGTGHPLPLVMGLSLDDAIVLNANLSSLPFDYVARVKVGGTHMSYFYFEQLPVIVPSSFTQEEREFVIATSKRLLATTHRMAEILSCPVNVWDDDERLVLTSRLDALFALKYRLSREDLLFILDPEDAMGKGYPSETFPGLKEEEMGLYGEYRTKRLVMEAFDALRRAGLWRL